MKRHVLAAVLFLVLVVHALAQNPTRVTASGGLTNSNGRTTGNVTVGLNGFSGASDGQVPQKLGSTITWGAGGGGGLSNYFGNARVVVVDPINAAQYTSAGILAYTNAAAAFTSWRPTGAAYVLYGAPTVTNRSIVYFAAGQHTFPTNQVIQDPLEIRGAGKFATELKLVGPSVHFLTVSNLYTSFYDLTVNDGARSTTAAIEITPVSGVHIGEIQRCWFNTGTNIGGAAIEYTTTGNGTKYLNNLFTPLGGVVMYSGPACTKWSFVNNTITVVAPASYGLYLQNGGTGEITGNRLTGSASSMMMQAGFGAFFIGNNYIDNEHTSGVGVTLGNASTHTISANFIHASGTALANASGARVIGNFISSYTSGQNTDAVGVTGGGSAIRSVFIGNYILGSGTGKAIGASSSNVCYFTDNILRMPTGDVAGSSISTNIFQGLSSMAGGTSSNVNQEVLAATTY